MCNDVQLVMGVWNDVQLVMGVWNDVQLVMGVCNDFVQLAMGSVSDGDV